MSYYQGAAKLRLTFALLISGICALPLTACQPHTPPMTATVLTENNIPELPSASGVEILHHTAYVVADDAPFLYRLDAETLANQGRVPLFALTEPTQLRLPKPTKPDLECMAALTWPGRGEGLLLLGSGSLPTRDRGWWVPVAETASEALQPELLNLTPLYTLLRAALPPGAVLNLEAAATLEVPDGGELLLLQRGLGTDSVAWLFRLPLVAALRYLAAGGGGEAAPGLRVQPFTLPKVAGHAAGFSGASFANGQLFVSASVEDTADAVLDGAVLGSFVGVMDVAQGTCTLAPLHWPDGHPYIGKVEGIAVRRQLGPGRFELLLVTDDDAGGSTALVAELHL